MAIRTLRPDDQKFLCSDFDVFELNGCISVTKLGDFVNLSVLFLTMWIVPDFLCPTS